MPIPYWLVGPSAPRGVRKMFSKTIDISPKPPIIKPMKTLFLSTSILSTIAEFRKAHSDFSAWEVTKKIRDKVMAGELIIQDWSHNPLALQGVPTNLIPHEPVLSIVRELFSEGLVPNYLRHDNGKYIQYQFSDSVPDASAQPTAKKAGEIAVGDIVTINDTVPWKRDYDGAAVVKITADGRYIYVKSADKSGLIYKSEIKSFTTPSSSPVVDPCAVVFAATAAKHPLKTPTVDMWNLLGDYIFNRGRRTTLKQMQSRLKGWQVTVRQIESHLSQSGYCLYTEVPFYNSYVA